MWRYIKHHIFSHIIIDFSDRVFQCWVIRWVRTWRSTSCSMWCGTEQIWQWWLPFQAAHRIPQLINYQVTTICFRCFTIFANTWNISSIANSFRLPSLPSHKKEMDLKLLLFFHAFLVNNIAVSRKFCFSRDTYMIEVLKILWSYSTLRPLITRRFHELLYKKCVDNLCKFHTCKIRPVSSKNVS